MRGTFYDVRASSIAADELDTSSTIAILPADDDVEMNDLQYKEFYRQVARSLEAQGFSVVSDDKAPAIVAFLSYGIGQPERRIRTFSVPTFGPTGGYNSTTNVSGFGNYATATTTTTPTYGVTGSQQRVEEYTTYSRFIALDAFFVREGSEPEPAFETVLKSTGSGGDLRTVFAPLLVGGDGIIGSNSGSAVKVMVPDYDQRIGYIRTGRTPSVTATE